MDFHVQGSPFLASEPSTYQDTAATYHQDHQGNYCVKRGSMNMPDCILN